MMSKLWLLSALVIGPLICMPVPLSAQTPSWSSPVQLSETGQFSWFSDVAADRSGQVHVVWASFITGYDAVMYATSKNGLDWTPPTDILALPYTGAATRPIITFDLQGNAHLVGRNDHKMVYHRVPVYDLQALPRWPPEKDMSQTGGAYFSAIAIGPDGWLHFVFTENPRAEECLTCYSIFYRQSRDGGTSWTSPILLTPVGNGAIKPQILASRTGVLHLVWDAGRGGGLAQVAGSTQVSYVTSRDGGTTWSDPIEFSGSSAGYPGSSGRFITIGEDGGGKLIVVWLKLPDDVPHYQISSDGGLNWSAPAPLPGVFGIWSVIESGLDTYSMATDSAGHIHLVMVGRLDRGAKLPNLIHLTWDGSSWSEPEVIFTPLGSTPVWPRIAIGLGNQLHVTWFTANNIFGTDAADADFRIWYSRKSISAPAVQPVVYPTPTLPPLPTATHSALQNLPTPPPVNPSPSEITFDALKTEVDDYGLIALSVAPVALFFFALLLYRRRR